MTVEDERNSTTSSSRSEKMCSIMGSKFPKSEIVYLLQAILVYLVAISCIANLSLNKDSNTELWLSLLCSSLGYLLPAPKIRKSR